MTMTRQGVSRQHLLRSTLEFPPPGGDRQLHGKAGMAKYEKAAEALRDEIRAGHPQAGERLPAETVLAERFRVSLPTIRQALGVLQAEGLIERRHGRGTYVREPRHLVARTNERHQWEKDRARQSLAEREKTGATERDTGLQVDDLVFSAVYDEVPANADLAAALGVREGEPLVRRSYQTRYRQEDFPFNVATSYLVRALVTANPRLLDDSEEPWPGGTQSQLHTVGIELDRVEERVTARPPSAEEAEVLGLHPGVSVLVLRKSCVDTEGRVVEVSDVILPGDRTEMVFVTPLERW